MPKQVARECNLLAEADPQDTMRHRDTVFPMTSAWIVLPRASPVYQKVLQFNGDQRPVGNMSDFEKARKAHNDKYSKPGSKCPARGNGKGGARTHVKGMVDEDNHEDLGNLSDSSASRCGSAT